MAASAPEAPEMPDLFDVFVEREFMLSAALVKKTTQSIEDAKKRMFFSGDLFDEYLELAAQEGEDVLPLSALEDLRAVDGDEILEALRAALDERLELSDQQRIIVEVFVQSNLQNIYKKNFQANEVRIKQENGIKDIQSYSFICCPRRWGKTFITAWFVACCLVSLVDTSLLIFSPSMRQCIMFMEWVKKGLGLLRLRGFDFTTEEHNAQKMTILRQVKGVDCRTEVRIVPPNEETVRGVSANIIICEEAACLSSEFFASIIVPLLQVQNTSLLAISTIKDAENYYTRVLDRAAASRERSAFGIYKFFHACARCREAGVAQTCKHQTVDQPAWMTASRADHVRQLYEITGEGDLYEQEIIGMSKNVHEPAFHPDLVRSLFRADKIIYISDPIIFRDPVAIYSCIDPTGGGLNSDLAIVSCIVENSKFIFVGMESINCRGPDSCFPQLVEHYRRLKLIPRLANAHTYVWVENNMVWQAEQIMWQIQTQREKGVLRDIHIMDNMGIEIPSVQLGQAFGAKTSTDHKVKAEMRQMFNQKLLDDSMCFLTDMVTVEHPAKARQEQESAQDAIRSLFMEQLLNYAMQIRPSTNPGFAPGKVTFSGKTSANGRKDDLAVTAQLVLYWSYTHIRRPFLQSR